MLRLSPVNVMLSHSQPVGVNAFTLSPFAEIE